MMEVLWRTAPLRIDVRLRGVEDEVVMQLPSGAVVQLGGQDVSAPVIETPAEVAGLPDRMTTTAREALAAPTQGLMVYDTTLHKLCVRGAVGWEAVTTTPL